VAERLELRIDWQQVDMADVQPAHARMRARLMTQSKPDPGGGKKLADRWRKPRYPQFRPGHPGKPRPAGLAPLQLRNSNRDLLPGTQRVPAPAVAEWLYDDAVSPSAYNPLGAFPFSASRVNMHGDIVTDRYPYRAVGVVVVADGDALYQCTGTLVAPSLVLTTAHCLWEFGGEVYDAAAFLPGYHLETAPFGAWSAVEVATTSNFRDGTSNCYFGEGVGCDDDIAVLRLEAREDARGRVFTLGEKIGWLGVGIDLYGFDPFYEEPLAQVSQFGYPVTHDGGVAMQRGDKVAAFGEAENLVFSSSPFGAGSSGSPLIANFGESAELDDEAIAGEDADANVVTAVVNTRADFNSDEVAAFLNEENFLDGVDLLCSSEPVACDTDLDDPIASRDMLLIIEEPAKGGVYSGIGNLRGWAVYEFGIESIEIYIDGEFQFLAPYGGERNDVGNRFPDIPNANYSGFSLAFGYLNLEPGEHDIEVVATSGTGDFTSRRSTFTVTKFDTPFVAADDEVRVEGAAVGLSSDTVTLDGITVDGKSYDIELQWDTASQGFELRAIEESKE
jgi:hypothetical protein